MGRTEPKPKLRGGRPRALGAWWTVAAALTVVLVATLGAAGYFGKKWYDQYRLDEARTEAVTAARQLTVNFLSISADSVDRDIQAVLSLSTGQFKEEYEKGKDELRKQVLEKKVRSRGEVLKAAWSTGDRDSGAVLIAADSTISNAGTEGKDRLSHYRMKLEVSLVDGKWLVSLLQFVAS